MRGIVAFGVVAAVGSGAMLIQGAGRSKETGPKLTHRITRGDLIVTVTEQGTLESSENTEIKNKVRGRSTVTWVIEGGTVVKPGDELLRLDTQVIDDAIAERSKYAHWSRSAAERSAADVRRAELAISEYLEGRYQSQLMTLEKDLAIAESNLRTERNMLDHANMMAERGYVSDLDVQDATSALERAGLNVGVKKTEIDALKEYTKKMQLETLKGNLKSTRARHEADKERAKMDGIRRDLAVEELEYCVVKAEKAGMVIHPSAASWKAGPEIEVGGTVYKEQVLLLMPDLSKMQVKLGIPEADVDRIEPEMAASVTLPDKTIDGEVSTVASVAAPAGLLTGNVVRYETIVKLPSVEGLKPGMSAEVDVIVSQHQDVLLIPVAAVAETAQGDFCWVKTAEGEKRRSLRLGDSDDVFTVVEAGLKQGDEVVLNTAAFVKEAQLEVLTPLDRSKSSKPRADNPPGDTKKQKSDSKTAKSKKGDSKPKLTGAQKRE